MGMTMTQKILAAHAGLKEVKSGELIKVKLDLVHENDITTPVSGDLTIGADSHTYKYGALGAFSTGAKSTDMVAGMATGEAWIKVPEAIKIELVGKMQKGACGTDIILHIIGMIGVDGALYDSMEFSGEGLKNLTMDDRFSMANMVIEAGAKNGIFDVDDQTIAYVKEHSTKEYKIYKADDDAVYIKIIVIDLATVSPAIAAS